MYNVCMNITLEQENNHWVMRIHDLGVAHATYQEFIGWDAALDACHEELEGRKGVKRMSYDIWHWDGRREQEAREYMTYFLLKHS